MDEARELKVANRAGTFLGSMSKVMGETQYADDLSLPRMLYCRILRSTHTHAKISAIDTLSLIHI